jgi:hypothetical protein
MRDGAVLPTAPGLREPYNELIEGVRVRVALEATEHLPGVILHHQQLASTQRTSMSSLHTHTNTVPRLAPRGTGEGCQWSVYPARGISGPEPFASHPGNAIRCLPTRPASQSEVQV